MKEKWYGTVAEYKRWYDVLFPGNHYWVMQNREQAPATNCINFSYDIRKTESCDILVILFIFYFIHLNN